MKKMILIVSVLVGLAVSVFADGYDRQILTVTTCAPNDGTNLVSSTNLVLRGAIESITIAPLTGATGDVSVVAVNEIATMSSVTLATTSSLSTSSRFVPRFYPTTAAGVAISGTTPERYVSVGDTIVFSVVNGNTSNRTFNCKIVYESKLKK